MALKPLSDRIIALKAKAEGKTPSGLLVPNKETPAYTTVEAVGPDVKGVKKGDQIIFKEYSATEVKINGTEYFIVKEEDVLAILDK